MTDFIGKNQSEASQSESGKTEKIVFLLWFGSESVPRPQLWKLLYGNASKHHLLTTQSMSAHWAIMDTLLCSFLSFSRSIWPNKYSKSAWRVIKTCLAQLISPAVKIAVITCSAFIFAHMWTPPTHKKHKHAVPLRGGFVWATAVSQHACFYAIYSHFRGSFPCVYYVIEQCGSFPNETWYCYCTLRNVFPPGEWQGVFTSLCLFLKSLRLRLHCLLTLSLWMRGNTCHMSCKS